MPRKVVFHSESAGDPQTVLQDDKDPMLTLNPDYLDCRSDTDPAGDLGKNNSHWTRKVFNVRFTLHIKIICKNVCINEKCRSLFLFCTCKWKKYTIKAAPPCTNRCLYLNIYRDNILRQACSCLTTLCWLIQRNACQLFWHFLYFLSHEN